MGTRGAGRQRVAARYAGGYTSSMSSLSDVGLVSTLHDPGGNMRLFLHACLPNLSQIYRFLVIVATSKTDPGTVASLENAGVMVLPDGTKEIGANRRRALRHGLAQENGDGAGAPFLHYCDFDRLLHWSLHYPRELRGVVKVKIPAADYLVLGRTPAAFESHPNAQRMTESLTNRVFSFIHGQEMDVTAGSCGLSRAAAEQIMRHSMEPTNATDTEWPLIIARLAPADLAVSYLATQGLAYETATFLGAAARAAADHPENWQRRLGLARDSVAAAIRLGESTPW